MILEKKPIKKQLSGSHTQRRSQQQNESQAALPSHGLFSVSVEGDYRVRISIVLVGILTMGHMILGHTVGHDEFMRRAGGKVEATNEIIRNERHHRAVSLKSDPDDTVVVGHIVGYGLTRIQPNGFVGVRAVPEFLLIDASSVTGEVLEVSVDINLAGPGDVDGDGCVPDPTSRVAVGQNVERGGRTGRSPMQPRHCQHQHKTKGKRQSSKRRGH